MDGLYTYTQPPEPSDEKLIVGYNLSKKEQMWRKPIIPSFKKLSERQRMEIIDLHRERWHRGMWFFNNGEPTYINGLHYDFLTFCDFEDFGGSPEYLEQQRWDFFFRELVRLDPRAYGQVILKCRRCGMSAEEMCQSVYTMLEDFRSKVGLQSNELQKKCLPELMRPIINMYVKRPKWMREQWYSVNGKKPRNSLELGSNTMDADADVEDQEEYLGGNIVPYPTTPSAMDGSKKRYIVMDEVWKWVVASPDETLGINKKCVVEYGIKGKISMLSTMGDSDAYHEAVKEGCKIYGESNPNVRDANGRTTSGLYKWFVAAIHSADIPQEVRDVKYGRVNKERAEEYIWNEVNKHSKDSKNYVFELRRMPMVEAHAMLSASGKSYFPIIRMDAQKNKLLELPKDQKPYVRGNLKETNSGQIYFEADELGIWLVAVHPYSSVERNINTKNRIRRDQNGKFHPPVNPEGCIGYDPIRYKTDNTVSKNLSKACGIVYKKFDYFNSGISSEYCALLLYRPDDPKEAHFEMVKACKYWGYPCMAERQVETTETVFEDYNMEAFLMRSSKDNKWGIWTDSQGKVVENGLQGLVTQFSAPKAEGDKDQVEAYPFEEGLIDYINFDMSNTTQSHVTMATIMCHEGSKQIEFTNVSEDQTRTYLQRLHEINPPRR